MVMSYIFTVKLQGLFDLYPKKIPPHESVLIDLHQQKEMVMFLVFVLHLGNLVHDLNLFLVLQIHS